LAVRPTIPVEVARGQHYPATADQQGNRSVTQGSDALTQQRVETSGGQERSKSSAQRRYQHKEGAFGKITEDSHAKGVKRTVDENEDGSGSSEGAPEKTKASAKTPDEPENDAERDGDAEQTKGSAKTPEELEKDAERDGAPELDALDLKGPEQLSDVNVSKQLSDMSGAAAAHMSDKAKEAMQKAKDRVKNAACGGTLKAMKSAVESSKAFVPEEFADTFGAVSKMVVSKVGLSGCASPVSGEDLMAISKKLMPLAMTAVSASPAGPIVAPLMMAMDGFFGGDEEEEDDAVEDLDREVAGAGSDVKTFALKQSVADSIGKGVEINEITDELLKEMKMLDKNKLECDAQPPKDATRLGHYVQDLLDSTSSVQAIVSRGIRADDDADEAQMKMLEEITLAIQDVKSGEKAFGATQLVSRVTLIDGMFNAFVSLHRDRLHLLTKIYTVINGTDCGQQGQELAMIEANQLKEIWKKFKQVNDAYDHGDKKALMDKSFQEIAKSVKRKDKDGNPTNKFVKKRLKKFLPTIVKLYKAAVADEAEKETDVKVKKFIDQAAHKELRTICGQGHRPQIAFEAAKTFKWLCEKIDGSNKWMGSCNGPSTLVGKLKGEKDENIIECSNDEDGDKGKKKKKKKKKPAMIQKGEKEPHSLLSKSSERARVGRASDTTAWWGRRRKKKDSQKKTKKKDSQKKTVPKNGKKKKGGSWFGGRRLKKKWLSGYCCCNKESYYDYGLQKCVKPGPPPGSAEDMCGC